MKNSRLLVVSDRFPHARDPISSSFVKSQVEYIKNHFGRVYVIALSPWVPKFLSRFSFMDSKGRWDGYAEDYSYDNVEVYFAKPLALPFDFSRRRRGDDSLKSAVRVIEKNKIDFDLIHAHFTMPSGYVGARLKEAYGKRLILTVHEDREWFHREMASKDDKILYAWKSSDRIIRVNRADLKEFERIGIERSKLVYLPNGFSPRLFEPVDKRKAREVLGLPQNKKILVNIAALQPYKGQKYLIRAMKRVSTEREDVLLYIVGKGSEKDHLQKEIDRCGLCDSVVLAGGDKPAQEIALWMNSCDIFVLSSLSESFGIVQIEAMACGKPVVATHNGGSEELILDKRLGILVEPKDPQGLADAILSGLDIDWDIQHILDYASQFRWERLAKNTTELYEEVLTEKLMPIIWE